MSTLAVSTRTIVRDTIISVLQTRTDKSVVRVPSFAISKKYLTQEETKQGNTYCVIVTDESPETYTHSANNWKMQVKIVCYAHHPDDPHAILDAMIEDLHDAMVMVRSHSTLHRLISNMQPVDMAADERTTGAAPWGQVVCTWNMSHARQ